MLPSWEPGLDGELAAEAPGRKVTLLAADTVLHALGGLRTPRFQNGAQRWRFFPLLSWNSLRR